MDPLIRPQSETYSFTLWFIYPTKSNLEDDKLLWRNHQDCTKKVSKFNVKLIIVQRPRFISNLIYGFREMSLPPFWMTTALSICFRKSFLYKLIWRISIAEGSLPDLKDGTTSHAFVICLQFQLNDQGNVPCLQQALPGHHSIKAEGPECGRCFISHSTGWMANLTESLDALQGQNGSLPGDGEMHF